MPDGSAELGVEMAHAMARTRADAKAHQDRLDGDFPGWNDARGEAPDEYWRHDARREFFVTAGTVLENAILGYVLLRDHLGDAAWWNDRFESLSPEKTESSKKEFAIMVKWFSFHALAMAVEETLRVIQRADPDRFDSDRPTIASITKAVLEACELAGHADLFRLSRLTRNTIHTNGIYLPDYGGDEDVTVDGQVFEFRVGGRLGWLNEEKIVWFFDRLLSAMDDLVRSDAVSSVASVPRGQAEGA